MLSAHFPPPAPALDQDPRIPGPRSTLWAVCSAGLWQEVWCRTWVALGGRWRSEVTASLPALRLPRRRGTPLPWQVLAHPSPSCPSPCSQFLQFRMKIINLKLEQFRDRVEFSGNPSKYDVSVTLRNVQLEDEGTYNCYVMNPPDRHRGHGRILLQVLLEGEALLRAPDHCCPPVGSPGSGLLGPRPCKWREASGVFLLPGLGGLGTCLRESL